MRAHYEQSLLIKDVPHVVHGFFMRHGGVSPKKFSSLNCSLKVGDEIANVEENRLRVLCSLGINTFRLMIPNIVHSDRSIVIDGDLLEKDVAVIDADALITCLPYVALGITYADCVPILLASSDGRCIAAIHAGWRGIAQDVIGKTITRLRECFRPNRLIAAIGPAISQSGFSITGDVLPFFKRRWAQFVAKDRKDFRVNLSKIAYEQLRICHVDAIEKVGGYTDLDVLKYFSHRRDKGESGRHIAIIALRHPSLDR